METRLGGFRLGHLGRPQQLGCDVVKDPQVLVAAIAALRQFGETELFLRGIIPQLGFPTAKIHYQQAERAAGGGAAPGGSSAADDVVDAEVVEDDQENR